MDWRETDGVRWLDARLPHGVRAAFSARVGGISEGDFASLNIGYLTDDEAEGLRRLAVRVRPSHGRQGT